MPEWASCGGLSDGGPECGQPADAWTPPQVTAITRRVSNRYQIEERPMTNGLTRRGFAGVALTAPFILRSARAAEPLLLRCSLDTAPATGATSRSGITCRSWRRHRTARSRPRCSRRGQLFADLKVAKALMKGQVEMACSGRLGPDRRHPRLRHVSASGASMASRSIWSRTAPWTERRARISTTQILSKLRTHVLGP